MRALKKFVINIKILTYALNLIYLGFGRLRKKNFSSTTSIFM